MNARTVRKLESFSDECDQAPASWEFRGDEDKFRSSPQRFSFWYVDACSRDHATIGLIRMCYLLRSYF